MLALLFSLSGMLLFCAAGQAAVQSKPIDYKDGETALRGQLFWDDALEGKRPGVLVVHEWWGLNDYARDRARQLAELGYVAFAVDMYGVGKVTEHPDEAGAWMKAINANVDAWVARAEAGLKVLKSQPTVDISRLAAIGYCFGGATVLEMAYAGLDVAGVVSFHGAMPLPADAQMSGIKARILIAHGSADPFTPPEQVEALRAALDKSGADWEMLLFGGAKHGFTNPDAGTYGMDALAYDEKADRRSWRAMRLMFEGLFGSTAGGE
jgi:dienelactone hydrolase